MKTPTLIVVEKTLRPEEHDELINYLSCAKLPLNTRLVEADKGGIPWVTSSIEHFDPTVTVVLGGPLTKELFAGSITELNGKHLVLLINGKAYSAVPIYSIAYGFQRPRMIQHIHAAFRAARRVLDGTEPEFIHQEQTHCYGCEKDTELFQEFTQQTGAVISLDTETVEGELYSYSVSWDKNRALYIPRTATAHVNQMLQVLSRAEKIIMHNAKYDIGVMRRAGHAIDISKVEDTMIMAHLLEEPEVGLKPLAFSKFGIRMIEYKEMVNEFGNGPALDYLREVHSRTWDDPAPIKTITDGVLKIRRPTNIHKRVTRILADYEKDNTTDVRKRWQGVKLPEGRRDVELVMGKMPEPNVSHVPIDKQIFYACQDADLTRQLFFRLLPAFQEIGEDRAYRMDIEILEMLTDMESRGMLVNTDYAYGELKTKVEIEIAKQQAEIFRAASRLVNPNSSKQVRELLFDMGIYKDESLSADKVNLSKFAAENPLIPAILEWRAGKKLLTTYINKFHEHVRPDNTVHTEFRITGTATGRLSSYKPNLQNQPAKTELGRALRDAYIARPGFTLVGTDYSQIEMRVAAHISNDPVMCEMFRSGADIHTETAKRMYLKDEVTKDERYSAKRVGFGILYGISEYGLYNNYIVEGVTSFTVDDCREQIQSWFKVYGGIENYILETKDFVSRNGYVVDIFGRRRTVNEALSSSFRLRADGYRKAVNMPIQSSAGGILKLAMAELTNDKDIGYNEVAFPVLQIHDEILWEIRDEALEDVVPVIIRKMENIYDLRVPIKADADAGKFWGSLKEWRPA